MENNLKKAYSEIYEILNLMEEEYVNKVPQKLRDLFKMEKEDNFSVNINTDKPLENQNLQKDTLTILAILYINYWSESDEEKQELIKLFRDVDKRNEEFYSTENLFKKQEKKANLNENTTNLQLIVPKNNFFIKIINKIKNLFKKNK